MDYVVSCFLCWSGQDWIRRHLRPIHLCDDETKTQKLRFLYPQGWHNSVVQCLPCNVEGGAEPLDTSAVSLWSLAQDRSIYWHCPLLGQNLAANHQTLYLVHPSHGSRSSDASLAIKVSFLLCMKTCLVQQTWPNVLDLESLDPR